MSPRLRRRLGSWGVRFALLVFLASLAGLVPSRMAGLRLDLILFVTLALVAGLAAVRPPRRVID